ncbi:hypothetical protein C0992_009145, partial [Termitomyces sp. T32_za158]
MDVDEEGRYERQEEEVVYHPGPSRPQGGSQSYARAMAQPLFEEYAPQAQMSRGTDSLLSQLEAVGQPVPATASFLQDNLAVVVMEGLLNQIKLMRRQRVTALEQIDHAAKRKLLVHDGSSVEPKWARPQPPQPVEGAQAVSPIVVPAPAAQFDVVIVATDPCTPAQYN